MRKALDRVYDVAAWLAAVAVFGIFVIMAGGSALRELGIQTRGTDDLVAWLCAAAGFLAMAQTFRRGDFVRVTLLLDKLGPRSRPFEIAALAIGAAFCGYLAWAAGKFVYESWDLHDMANGQLAVPLWIPQVSVVLGTVLLLIAVVEELITVLAGGKPSYVLAVEERHARGDFSEDV